VGLRAVLAGLTARLPTQWPLAVLAAISILSLALLIWQVVGSLRATAARARGDGGALVMAGTAVLAAIAMFLNAELNLYAARAAPGPQTRAAALPYDVDRQGAVVLRGDIDFTMLARFEATLDTVPDLRRVDLQSDGGLIYAARAMAARIAAHRLETRASGLCASACTLVFMAGTRRSLGPEGTLGFHGYAGNLPQSLHPTAPEEARDRAYMAGRGVAQGFLDRAYATPHDALWRPTRAELRAAGVLTPPG
jgi:hypothetical protein